MLITWTSWIFEISSYISTWTAKKKDCIFLKQRAVKDAGYKCEIWVYNTKGEKVECYN